MRLVTLVLWLVTSGVVCGQTDYVVTLKNDTLRGDVRILTYDLMDRVQVKTEKKKEIFTAVQVSQLSLDGKIYKPVRIENNIRMMQLLQGGYLSLYAFRVQNQATYDGRFLVKLGGASIEVPNITFKKGMAGFLEDCGPVSERIKAGEWSKKDLEAVVIAYNQCITEGVPASAATPTPTTTEPTSTPAASSPAITALRQKLEQSDLASKKDALDLLTDIAGRLERKQPVPNYLAEGLKGYVGSQPSMATELEAVLALLKN